MNKMNFELKPGSLWQIIRTVEVSGQGRIDPNTYGILIESEYVPFCRTNGEVIPRWNVKFLSSNKLFTIRKISEAIWKFYFLSVEEKCK